MGGPEPQVPPLPGVAWHRSPLPGLPLMGAVRALTQGPAGEEPSWEVARSRCGGLQGAGFH